MKIEMELPEPPEGYEYTGEYRRPNKGEYYQTGPMAAVKESTLNFKYDHHVILRKKRRKVTREVYMGTVVGPYEDKSIIKTIDSGITVTVYGTGHYKIYKMVEEWEDDPGPGEHKEEGTSAHFDRYVADDR